MFMGAAILVFLTFPVHSGASIHFQVDVTCTIVNGRLHFYAIWASFGWLSSVVNWSQRRDSFYSRFWSLISLLTGPLVSVVRPFPIVTRPSSLCTPLPQSLIHFHFIMIRNLLIVGLGAVGSYAVYKVIDRLYFSEKKEDTERETDNGRKTSQQVYDNADSLEGELGGLTTSSSLSANQLAFLFALLQSDNPGVVKRTLLTIGNLAAFTSNQNAMRESGLLQAVVDTLKKSDESPGIQACCCQALANLAMNVANQPVVQSCLPFVVNKIVQSTESDATTLSGLKLLTNMTVMEDYHHHLYLAVPKLLQLSTTDHDAPVQLQSLKVLVNLSCNQASIQTLLRSPVLPTFLSLLQSTMGDVQLRALTFVANVISSQEDEVLPSDFAADSLQAVLYGSGGRRRDIYATVLKLTKHPSEDVRRQASRVLVAKMLRYDNQD